MARGGRILGIVLLIFGALIGVLGITWLLVARVDTGPGGLLLGVVLVAILTLPIIGTGVYLLALGGSGAVDEHTIAKERRLLNMVEAQGRLAIAEAALELRGSRDDVKNLLYDLAGKQLFSGYINWDEGVLYARPASQLRGDKCPHCGGQIELSGKGIVRCKYCQSDIFLS
jgi:hypothetical protein